MKRSGLDVRKTQKYFSDIYSKYTAAFVIMHNAKIRDIFIFLMLTDVPF